MSGPGPIVVNAGPPEPPPKVWLWPFSLDVRRAERALADLRREVAEDPVTLGRVNELEWRRTLLQLRVDAIHTLRPKEPGESEEPEEPEEPEREAADPAAPPAPSPSPRLSGS